MSLIFIYIYHSLMGERDFQSKICVFSSLSSLRTLQSDKTTEPRTRLNERRLNTQRPFPPSLPPLLPRQSSRKESKPQQQGLGGEGRGLWSDPSSL
jgi:hypothetical protein